MDEWHYLDTLLKGLSSIPEIQLKIDLFAERQWAARNVHPDTQMENRKLEATGHPVGAYRLRPVS